jgi:hypothetical protein
LVLRAENNESANYLVAAIALVTAVLVYTMRRHPQARKSRVALGVLLPFVIGAVAIGGWRMREERRIARERELVRPAELEATDVRLEGTGSSRNVAGRVRNRSSHEVYAITFLVSFLENAETMFTYPTTAYVRPPQRLAGSLVAAAPEGRLVRDYSPMLPPHGAFVMVSSTGAPASFLNDTSVVPAVASTSTRA